MADWFYLEPVFLDEKLLLVEEAKTRLALGQPIDVESLIDALAKVINYAADLEQQIQDEELYGLTKDGPITEPSVN
jgi:hypothetical protein